MSSVGNLAYQISTLYSTSAATTATQDPSKFAELKEKFKQVVAAVKGSQEFQKIMDAKQVGGGAYSLYKAGELARGTIDANTYTYADMVRMAALIAAAADPTGVAKTVVAYSFPKCSEIKRNL